MRAAGRRSTSEGSPSTGADIRVVLAESRWGKPDRSGHARGYTVDWRRIHLGQRFLYSMNQPRGDLDVGQDTHPLRRATLANPGLKAARDTIAVRDAARVGDERRIRREVLEVEGPRAGQPLRIAPDRDDDRPVSGVERLIGHEVGVGIAVAPGILPGEQDVLGYINECGAGTVGEGYEDSPLGGWERAGGECTEDRDRRI